jgi:hypothetical protein
VAGAAAALAVTAAAEKLVVLMELALLAAAARMAVAAPRSTRRSMSAKVCPVREDCLAPDLQAALRAMARAMARVAELAELVPTRPAAAVPVAAGR